jgi:hypothetical protein
LTKALVSRYKAEARFLKNFDKNETFEKGSILFKIKEGENFNHRNIFNISRIET